MPKLLSNTYNWFLQRSSNAAYVTKLVTNKFKTPKNSWTTGTLERDYLKLWCAFSFMVL